MRSKSDPINSGFLAASDPLSGNVLGDEADVVLAHRQQSEYFSALSHELRTPLNGLLGYANLLSDGNYGALSETQLRAVGEIRGAASYLLEVIESLLEFSKVSRGRREARADRFRLDVLLERLETRLRPLAAAKHITVSLESEPIEAFSDEALLERIVTNLLGNAIKFTPAEGQIRLVGKAVPESEGFEVGVQDTGPGIPPDGRKRIFEPFVQLAAHNVRAHGGTGLGLALCRWYASLLQGVVGVEAPTRRGAYFFVLLPDRLVSSVAEPLQQELFQARLRQAAMFAKRVPDQFSVLEISKIPAGVAAFDELRRLLRPSDLIAGGDGGFRLGLHGAEALAARMAGERLMNRFLYEHRASVQVKLLSFEDIL